MSYQITKHLNKTSITERVKMAVDISKLLMIRTVFTLNIQTLTPYLSSNLNKPSLLSNNVSKHCWIIKEANSVDQGLHCLLKSSPNTKSLSC